MPLPDERPRGSVANLIGRFEQQTKRHPQSSPRSASVLSHDTGESVKEEPKDKREWPAKSTTMTNDKPSNTVVSPPWLRRSMPPEPVPELVPQPATDTTPPAQPTDAVEPSEQIIILPTQPTELEVSITAPTPITITAPVELAPEPESESEPEPIQIPEAPKEVAVPVPELSPIVVAAAVSPEPVPTPTPPKTPPPPIVKPTIQRTTRTPPRAAGKSSIKSPARPAASQPLRPQHTGTSTVSASGTAKKPIPRTAPTTPARPKTPVRPSAGGAAVIPPRAKTPVTRPRTPSTSLFAPTASSLARSRSQQPPLPGSVKKTSSSNTTAERLSKPTASSLSKARAPPVPPIPSNATTITKSTATITAHSVRGGTIAKGTMKVPSSSIRIKKEPTKGKTATGAKAKVTTAGDPTAASSLGREGANDDHSDLGHTSEADVAHPSEQDHHGSHASDAAEHSDLSPQQDSFGSTLVSGPEGKMDPTNNVTSDEDTAMSGAIPDHNGGGKSSASGNELEQIVNLLEKPGRSVSYIFPEDMHEIPDEE